MPRAELSAGAAEDLAEIYEYINSECSDFSIADDFADRLSQAFELLASNRFVGVSEEQIAPGLRSFAKGRYMVYYFPTDFGGEIFRVIHSARDRDKIFDESRYFKPPFLSRTYLISNTIHAALIPIPPRRGRCSSCGGRGNL